MTTTLTIDRASLTLPSLVATGSRDTTTSGFWIPEEGVGEPEFEPRYSYAPDSVWIPGRSLLAVVLEQGTLPLRINAKADTAVALAAKRRELEAALSQFVYPVTLDIDGATQTWSADFAWPKWASQHAADRDSFIARATVIIPVNPPGA